MAAAAAPAEVVLMKNNGKNHGLYGPAANGTLGLRGWRKENS
jgi:hypothetical protein